ncbi:unnamed protein product, partial [Owenia fusiformis]
TDRFLRNRLGKWSGVSFFVNTVNRNLNGFLTLDVYAANIDQTTSNLTLISWDSDTLVWRKVNTDCEGVESVTDEPGVMKFQICSDASEMTKRQKRQTTHYGGKTQFALSEVNEQFKNTPPKITSRDHMNITEHSGQRFSFKLSARDEEG